MNSWQKCVLHTSVNYGTAYRWLILFLENDEGINNDTHWAQ